VTTNGWLVFVSGLSLANLLLLLLLARRVHQLAKQRQGPASTPWLAPGSQVKDFATTTTAGERVSLAQLRGRQSVVGFFSAGCKPCEEQVPVFAQHAAAAQAVGNGDTPNLLAVIVGSASECAHYQAALEGTVRVVREERRGPVTTAFATHAFPGIYLLDADGKVVDRGPSVARVTGKAQGQAAERL
jgi:AhpC/TSA family protein